MSIINLSGLKNESFAIKSKFKNLTGFIRHFIAELTHTLSTQEYTLS